MVASTPHSALPLAEQNVGRPGNAGEVDGEPVVETLVVGLAARGGGDVVGQRTAAGEGVVPGQPEQFGVVELVDGDGLTAGALFEPGEHGPAQDQPGRADSTEHALRIDTAECERRAGDGKDEGAEHADSAPASCTVGASRVDLGPRVGPRTVAD